MAACSVKFAFVVILSVICGSNSVTLFSNDHAVNGGIGCAGCTFVVGLIEQLGQVHNESITTIVDGLCKLLPSGPYRVACQDIVHHYGPMVIDLLYAKAPPDVVCHTIKFCTVDPGQQYCHLFRMSEDSNPLKDIQKMKQILKRNSHMEKLIKLPALCKIPGIKFICDLASKVFERHFPALDLDLDGFSTITTLRGSYWRGQDCFDADSTKHPGAKPLGSDVEVDSNCNGIYGVTKDGTPYEDLLCKNSGAQGVAILGDSAGAHFHIPDKFLMANIVDEDILSHLPVVIENELDWPMMSATTGYMNITWPIIEGPTHSIYSMMRERNRCNHRDYQNIGVNGARSSNLLKNMHSYSRNQTADHPVLMFYALVGNDVCNGHPDTLAHMTTPQQMRENYLKTLQFLETKLPRGSHVMVIGLADGRVLFDNVRGRYHPVGALNQDVTYSDFYSYLNCLQISPCKGWMTTNDTLRDLTFKRVGELNDVLKDTSRKYKHKFEHFDIEYLDCPLMPVLDRWIKEHGPHSGWQLIETVDGFHPNQYAEALSAQYTWEYLEKYLPHFLGPVNPHNRQIQDTFGDQGGY